jgi:hypothetical protein
MKYIHFEGDNYYLVVREDGYWKWASDDRRIMITMGKSVPDDGKYGWYEPEKTDPAETASRYGWMVLVDDIYPISGWDDH